MSHFHRALILIKTPTLRAEHSFKIDNFVVNIVLKETIKIIEKSGLEINLTIPLPGINICFKYEKSICFRLL